MRLVPVREDGRKVGEGEEVREGGTDDKGRGGDGLLVLLKYNENEFSSRNGKIRIQFVLNPLTSKSE